MSATRPRVTLPPAVETPPYNVSGHVLECGWERMWAGKGRVVEGTYQTTSDDNRAPVRGEGSRELPDVDQEHRELQNGPAAEFLTPGRPQFTPK